MVDRISPAQRSKNMQAIRSKDTVPERVVRSLVHSAGYRFRLHRNDLPGRPDMVLPRHKAIIFVHGCYWHGHGCPRGGRGPKSNQGYWGPKLERTRIRDAANRRALEAAGWRVHTVWECQLLAPDRVLAAIVEFLNGGSIGERTLTTSHP